MATKIDIVHDDSPRGETKRRDGTHVVFEAIDAVEEKQVVRKLDTFVLPLMIFVYFCMCKSLDRHAAWNV